MTDPTSAAPSDAEIDGLCDQFRWDTAEGRRACARAVLAKWGAPQPVARVTLTDEQIDDYIRHADVRGRWGESLARWAIRHYKRAHGIGIGNGEHHE